MKQRVVDRLKRNLKVINKKIKKKKDDFAERLQRELKELFKKSKEIRDEMRPLEQELEKKAAVADKMGRALGRFDAQRAKNSKKRAIATFKDARDRVSTLKDKL